MEEEGDYTSACVSTALKRYRRRRGIKDATLALLVSAAAGAPWFLPLFFQSSSILGFKLEGSSILIWYVGILVVLIYAWTESNG
jgi:hypothetical protein